MSTMRVAIKFASSGFILIMAFLLSVMHSDEDLLAISSKTNSNNSIQNALKENKSLQNWEFLKEAQKNNLKTIDLSDLRADLPLTIGHTKLILQRAEKWEHSTWNPQKDRDTLGYPTIVKNVHGRNPDGKYYLFYAHHDPTSGIGCAVAVSIEGPFKKLAKIDSVRKDSQVLVCPGKPGQCFHYSSPCVVWNEDEQLWFMYFHFLKDEWNERKGHQKTALATCPDLHANIWTPWTGENGNLIVVLPTTSERWMNSQSSYHAIQRLPDGRWLAFLRGTGGEYEVELRTIGLISRRGEWKQGPCKLGFATSTDGRNWSYFPENPIIHQRDAGDGKDGVYRPHFIGYLGNETFLVCWSESEYYDKNSRIVYGITSDFKTVQRDKRGYATWPNADGLISPWREGNKLYLFAGKYLHIMELPIVETPPP